MYLETWRERGKGKKEMSLRISQKMKKVIIFPVLQEKNNLVPSPVSWVIRPKSRNSDTLSFM